MSSAPTQEAGMVREQPELEKPLVGNAKSKLFDKYLANLNADLSTKTAVITGSCSGLGYATCVGLLSKGCRVILACRNMEKAFRAQKSFETELASRGVSLSQNQIMIIHIDLSELKSVHTFAEKLKSMISSLDILINNAGLNFFNQQVENQMSVDGFELTYQCNFLAHFLLTSLLLPLLRNSSDQARIIQISSYSHYRFGVRLNIQDVNSPSPVSGFIGRCIMDKEGNAARYWASKQAVVLFSQELNRRLNDAGLIPDVVSICADPGHFQSALLEKNGVYKMEAEGNCFMSSAYDASLNSIAASTLQNLELDDYVQPSGCFKFSGVPEAKPQHFVDRQLGKELWTTATEQSGAIWNIGNTASASYAQES